MINLCTCFCCVCFISSWKTLLNNFFHFSRSRIHFVAHHTVRQRNRAGQSSCSVRRRWRTDDWWQPAHGLRSAGEGARRCVSSQGRHSEDETNWFSCFTPFFQHVVESCRAGVHRPTRSAVLWNSQSAPVQSAVSHSGVRFRNQPVLRLLPQEKTDPAFSASSGFQLYHAIRLYSLAMSSVN